MRVALVTREYPPEVYGGAGVHIEYLAAALADSIDARVHCFGAPREDPLVAAAYQPWDELTGGAPYRSALATLSADLAIVAGVEGSDLVHTHTWYANLAGHFAKLCFDIPHVMTTHSLEPLRPWKREQLAGGYALSSFAERTAIEHADAIIAVSERMRDDILGAYPQADPDRVEVIYNGIDTTEYHPVTATDVLEREGIDPDRPTVVFVGRITRQKGVTHLLDAAAHLVPEAQLVLCAGAPDTPELAAEVRAAVESLRREREAVIWIERMLPRADIVQILSHATLFACPSIYEPFGLVNVEAMACGIPVVGSAVGGIPEIIVEGETGHLVSFEPGPDPFGTPAHPERFARELAEAMNDLLGDPGRAEKWGAASRDRVLTNFAWPAIADQTVALYERLLR